MTSFRFLYHTTAGSEVQINCLKYPFSCKKNYLVNDIVIRMIFLRENQFLFSSSLKYPNVEYFNCKNLFLYVYIV